MIDIIIKDFPFPPSVNQYLMPVMGKVKRGKRGNLYAQGRMVKTATFREYETACTYWQLKYQKGLDRLREEIKQRKDLLESQGKTFALKVEYFVLINKHEITDKNNRPLRNDVDNRLKPAGDNLFRILGIDDKYCFSLSIEKAIAPQNQLNQMIVKITETQAHDKNYIFTQLRI